MKKLKIKENVKTQRKLMSDFPGKIVGIACCDPLFFVAKIFFRIFRKNVEFCFNEIDCKTFAKFFSVNHFELFFNSLKLTIKNFRNFLMLNSLKTFQKIFITEFIEK